MKPSRLKSRPSRLQARKRASQLHPPETGYYHEGNPAGTDFCPRCSERDPGSDCRMIQVGLSYLAMKCNGRKPNADYPRGIEPCGYLRKTN